jgi:hypothetical protein
MLKKIHRPSRFAIFIFVSLLFAGLGGLIIKPEIPTRISLPVRTCLLKPKFSDYPVKPENIYAGPAAWIDLSGNKEAASNRAFIRQAAARGSNFAGHYIVAEWGCGIDCQNHAVIDTKSGRLIAYGPRSAFGVEFYKDSRLLIFNPRHGLIRDIYSAPIARTAYFKIEGNELVPICD